MFAHDWDRSPDVPAVACAGGWECARIRRRNRRLIIRAVGVGLHADTAGRLAWSEGGCSWARVRLLGRVSLRQVATVSASGAELGAQLARRVRTPLAHAHLGRGTDVPQLHQSASLGMGICVYARSRRSTSTAGPGRASGWEWVEKWVLPRWVLLGPSQAQSIPKGSRLATYIESPCSVESLPYRPFR